MCECEVGVSMNMMAPICSVCGKDTSDHIQLSTEDFEPDLIPPVTNCICADCLQSSAEDLAVQLFFEFPGIVEDAVNYLEMKRSMVV